MAFFDSGASRAARPPMPTAAVLRHPIRWLRFQAPDGSPADPSFVEIVPMTRQHAKTWHGEVQPLIDNQYVKLDPARPFEAARDTHAGVRADVGWNWPRNLLLAKGWNTVRPAAALAERAVAFCILAQTGRERTPIGMLTAVPAYASPYPGDTAKLGFVWYLSAAPAEHYAARGLRRVSGVAYALLDIAIQTRLDLGESAAIFLHADPAGGEQLIAFYVDKCGMTRLWDNKPISLVRQVRAGEYLAMTHAQAMQFAARFDSFRTA